MVCCFFVAISAVLALPLLLLLWLRPKLDGNLTLLLMEKIGKSVDSLQGKVVWITGGSSGIGQCLAHELAAVGVKLALSGTDEEKLKKVKEECIAKGLKTEDILLVPFNIADFASHEKQVQKVLDTFGQIDILVNNAGRTQRADFASINIQVDRDLFDVNVFGGLSLSRLVLKHFLSRGGGQFVINSSIAGKTGTPGSASYTGSKHALHGYYECLRTEYGSRGIDVTLACPGPVHSDLLQKAFKAEPGQTVQQSWSASDPRMATDRCSHLIAVAMANKLDEVWIADPFFLLMFYAAQYTPSIFRAFISKHYTPERLLKMRDGK